MESMVKTKTTNLKSDNIIVLFFVYKHKNLPYMLNSMNFKELPHLNI